MRLSSIDLEAFFEVAKVGHFTRAAHNLGLTQSALSQRISKLEDALELTLFVRDRKGLLLTEIGKRLLSYCQNARGLEDEFLAHLKGDRDELAGVIRVAAFSSVLRSVLLPALSPFLRKNPKVICEFQMHETSEIPGVLERAQADFVLLDHSLAKANVVEELLGFESYVVVESSRFEGPKDLYFDHDERDSLTELYFSYQKLKTTYRRAFVGEIYGILDAVEAGLGRAVVSKHLLAGRRNIQVVEGYKPYRRPVNLLYFERSYYSKLQIEMLKILKAEVSKLL